MCHLKFSRQAACLAALAISVCLVRPMLAQQAEPVRVLALPAELTPYRSWKPLLKAPREMPLELWIKCDVPTEAGWEAEKPNGPHTRRLILVYANPVAQKSLKNAKGKSFPTGSIIAKEKLTAGGNRTEFSGVAFMVKRAGDQFAGSGGWEFRYFPSSDSQREQTQAACAACHKDAANDFVFGEYPQK